MNTPTVDFAQACMFVGTRCRSHLCHIDNCNERARLRALLAEHNTPTPDPPPACSKCNDTGMVPSGNCWPGWRPCLNCDGPAVPVQEPTCTTCDDTRRVPCNDPLCHDRTDWHTHPCPVCAVPNPESPEGD